MLRDSVREGAPFSFSAAIYVCAALATAVRLAGSGEARHGHSRRCDSSLEKMKVAATQAESGKPRSCSMSREKTPLQFKLMAPQAQAAAVHRLALSGNDVTEITSRTGLSETQVRSYLSNIFLADPVRRGLISQWANSRNPKTPSARGEATSKWQRAR
jgi:DNA-binding NarL/FixJ family response regulator